MRNYQEQPITKEEKVDWLNALFNEHKDSQDEAGIHKMMLVYSILKDNVINEGSAVLRLH